MSKIVEILTGIGFLIGIYLFLQNGSTTVKIIDSMAKNAINGISVLQGNSIKING